MDYRNKVLPLSLISLFKRDTVVFVWTEYRTFDFFIYIYIYYIIFDMHIYFAFNILNLLYYILSYIPDLLERDCYREVNR